MFPYMLSKVNPFFSFEDSRFGVQKTKEQTARIALFKELENVPCIYTMESSFAGMDKGKEKGNHFTTGMLESLGVDLCRTLLIYKNIYVPPELSDLFKIEQEGNKKEPDPEAFNNAIMKELVGNKALINAGDGDSSEGSDDAPSEDNLEAEKLVKALPIVDKTLKHKIKIEKERKILIEKEKALPPKPKRPEAPPAKRI